MIRRGLFLASVLLMLLLVPAQAQAGELIDRAVAGLQTDNVYVDPDADPTLTEAQAAELRDRIAEKRAEPMYIVVAPEEIAREAGGDPTQALGRIGDANDRAGTYVIVAGRKLRALSRRARRAARPATSRRKRSRARTATCRRSCSTSSTGSARSVTGAAKAKAKAKVPAPAG